MHHAHACLLARTHALQLLRQALIASNLLIPTKHAQLLIKLPLHLLELRIHARRNVHSLELPYVGLHTHAVELMFSDIGQPDLYDVFMAVQNLDGSPPRYALEVLLRFFVCKV